MAKKAKGGKKKLRKLWDRLEQTGAVVHAYTDPGFESWLQNASHTPQQQ